MGFFQILSILNGASAVVALIIGIICHREIRRQNEDISQYKSKSSIRFCAELDILLIYAFVIGFLAAMGIVMFLLLGTFYEWAFNSMSRLILGLLSGSLDIAALWCFGSYIFLYRKFYRKIEGPAPVPIGIPPDNL